MSDNIIVNQPTTVGATIATDDVGGVQHQLVKVEFGADGAATRVTTGNPLPVDPSGVTSPVSVASLPLPTGAATGAKQDTGNTSVASIDTKTPALGQALNAASVPVVLPATQITTLTPPAAITGFALEAGHLATIDAHIPAQGQALAAASMPVVLPATQITTLTPPAAIVGFALEAGHLATIDSHIPAQGQALSAASMPVVLPATQITTLTPPAAIVGFALEAGHLATIDSHIPAQGQALSAASMPVVLPATQITTLTPPAAIVGFALEAGHLATIDTSTAKIPSQGQAAMVASMPVVIASNQSAIPISAASLPLPSNAAQETGGNLASIAASNLLHAQNNPMMELLSLILIELRVMNLNIKVGLNTKDELDLMRSDEDHDFPPLKLVI